ncbi:MAG: hypothetical protein NC320_10675 [Clostridium sp.]|nr:hypothetical protein [Muribaculum sp.]MCM1227864.1 hypothetical protein [Clostridium sp.]
MEQYKFSRDNLYDGCLMASIVHAIMMLRFPEMSYEHSWDGNNYSMNDGCGCRGTITFAADITVGAFQSVNNEPIPYRAYLPDNEKVVQVAEYETLQYLLEDINGKTYPVVTEIFWGEGKNMFGIDLMDVFFEKGGYLICNHLLPIERALNYWQEYYEMTDDERQLAMDIFLMKKNIDVFTLNDILLDKIKALFRNGVDGGIEECVTSFSEINIHIAI